jgi:hypothetical protein
MVDWTRESYTPARPTLSTVHRSTHNAQDHHQLHRFLHRLSSYRRIYNRIGLHPAEKSGHREEICCEIVGLSLPSSVRRRRTFWLSRASKTFDALRILHKRVAAQRDVASQSLGVSHSVRAVGNSLISIIDGFCDFILFIAWQRPRGCSYPRPGSSRLSSPPRRGGG